MTFQNFLGGVGKPTKIPYQRKGTRVMVTQKLPNKIQECHLFYYNVQSVKFCLNPSKKSKGTLWLSTLHNDYCMTVPKFAILLIPTHMKDIVQVGVHVRCVSQMYGNCEFYKKPVYGEKALLKARSRRIIWSDKLLK